RLLDLGLPSQPRPAAATCHHRPVRPEPPHRLPHRVPAHPVLLHQGHLPGELVGELPGAQPPSQVVVHLRPQRHRALPVHRPGAHPTSAGWYKCTDIGISSRRLIDGVESSGTTVTEARAQVTTIPTGPTGTNAPPLDAAAGAATGAAL